MTHRMFHREKSEIDVSKINLETLLI